MSADATGAAVDARTRSREVYHEADVVIVGAGVLGCALAYALANQGRSVLLLEHNMHEPDRIVGELMQPGGVASLRRLGLADCIEGIDAIPCRGYHVVYDGDDIAIPYPPVDGDGHVPMDAYVPGSDEYKKKDNKRGDGGRVPNGRSFHHGRFIMQLRRKCLAHPNITVFETKATGLIRARPLSNEVLGVHAETTVRLDGSPISREDAAAAAKKDKESGAAVPSCPTTKKPDFFFGQLTVVADGYKSDFRSEVLDTSPIVKSKFYALELIDCPLEPKGFGHVFINSSAFPILLYQIGSHETRALIDVPNNLPAASVANGGVRGYIRNVVIPSLPENVHACVEAALADGKIPRSMPNSWLPPAPRSAITKAASQGVILLGDAYNMRHPLTGGGMTVALNDAVVLSGLLAPDRVPRFGDHAAVARAMGEFHWTRKRLTSIVNVLAQALYSLFAANSRPLRMLQQGCFQYFRRGWAAQPMGLLGGIIRKPLVLAYHFFSVAFLAIWLNTVEVITGGSSSTGAAVLGLVKLPLAIADGILVLWTACVVFLPVFWRELR
ncbi:squalene monooxygenase [Sporothrix schenckii 1099-18]|uniref:Squalene monooxygenase n=1 Tax=Sporothrix schenckii 1099-18 TaxID=1397361 RepID=A0A0F2LYD2_SPOSC|nr:squalene monooxygenase [Sporothrix schenckii 1099-18]KJR82462.1 squalene monooxygenase [Sporothrix schenckii 1099-18]